MGDRSWYARATDSYTTRSARNTVSWTVTTGLRSRMSLFASHAAAVPHCVHVAAATLARPSTGASAADPERPEEAQAAQKARHAACAPSRRLAAHCCG